MHSRLTISDLKHTPAGRRSDNSHLFVEEVKPKRQKYNNQKMIIDGLKFDSKREARHYIELRRLQTLGEISGLKHHEVFILSICKYEADFTYYNKDGGFVVCDVKGVKTPVYLLKKKLMKAEKNIDILEVK
jgi:hypothetical protein